MGARRNNYITYLKYQAPHKTNDINTRSTFPKSHGKIDSPLSLFRPDPVPFDAMLLRMNVAGMVSVKIFLGLYALDAESFNGCALAAGR